jgi:hypothetical protein
MKVKTNEIYGTPLAWAVAKILHLRLDPLTTGVDILYYDGEPFLPDTYWHQGGPILKNKSIGVRPAFDDGWTASIWANDITFFAEGYHPLLAAMRCLVASELGDEVDVPRKYARKEIA